MKLLQNIQTLHLQGTLAYYLNSYLAVYTDLTSYIFSKNILMPFMHYFLFDFCNILRDLWPLKCLLKYLRTWIYTLAVTISRDLSYSSWTVQANIFTSVWQSFVGTQRFSHSCSSQIQPICVSLLTYHSLEVWRVVSGRNSTCGTRTTLAFYEEICSSPLLQAATESILQSKPGLIGNGFRKAGIFPWNTDAVDMTRMGPSAVFQDGTR